MAAKPAKTRTLFIGVITALALVMASCGGSDTAGSDRAASSNAADPRVEGDVTIFAAASLTEAFGEIGKNLEKAYPDAKFRFNFAGSSTLAQQINQGAPADIFVSANKTQMDTIVDAGNAADKPRILVQNKLQIVVPAANPGQITGLKDFSDSNLDIAICAKDVPCGQASQKVFELAGVNAKPDTLEKDVKAVLTKVSLGEADAGLVYVTDVASSTADIEGIDFPAADEAINSYPIVAVKNAPNATGAKAFTDYVTSADGRAILQKYGFITEVS